jgi:hypothetical protein
MNIIIQSYRDVHNARNEELEYCLQQNLQHPLVKQVLDITDYPNPKFELNFKYKVIPFSSSTEWHSYHHQNRVATTADRLTFAVAFNIAAKYCAVGEYIALMNADIILDRNTEWINAFILLNSGTVLGLSRHEYNRTENTAEMDVTFSRLMHAHTQDAWIFKNPLRVANCDFPMGVLGCDNAIAHRIKTAGYNIINKPMQFKILHVDAVRGKTAANYLAFHHAAISAANAAADDSTNEKTQEGKPSMIGGNRGAPQSSPEDVDQLLLPNMDIMPPNLSLDYIAQLLNLSLMERYNIICNMFTAKIAINNKAAKSH